jgi:hypothetical protein
MYLSYGDARILDEQYLELLAATIPELGWTPLYWDLQGVTEPGDLRASLTDTLEDAEPNLVR